MAATATACDAQIPQFYAGKSIFITGGTGFIGKVLIERILSTCPDVGTLFVLVRQKKNRNSISRLQEMKQAKVFDVIRNKNPEQLDKIQLVDGNITQPNLGMSEDSIKDIQEVSIVFHVAATVKFEEPLGTAVSFNVRPVMELLRICDELPHMEVLIHVSTAYSYCEKIHVEEKVYPPPVPLHSLMNVIESLDEDLLAQITPQYISPKPNTYTFTKAMAEHVIATHQRNGKYAVVICRPSIVISTQSAPFPGWVDNFAGPSGVVAAAGAGLMHTLHCHVNNRADMIPADIVTHVCVAAAWKASQSSCSEVCIYNVCTNAKETTWVKFEAALRASLKVEPFQSALWYPSGFITGNKLVYQISEFFLQTLPLHAVQHLTKLLGIKLPLDLIAVERRVSYMNKVLTFFAQREWQFDCGNLHALWKSMTPADQKLYNFDTQSIDWSQQLKDFFSGTRRFLLKESDDPASRKEAQRRNRMLRAIHYGLLIILFILFVRVLFTSTTVCDAFSSGISILGA